MVGRGRVVCDSRSKHSVGVGDVLVESMVSLDGAARMPARLLSPRMLCSFRIVDAAQAGAAISCRLMRLADVGVYGCGWQRGGHTVGVCETRGAAWGVSRQLLPRRVRGMKVLRTRIQIGSQRE